MKKCKPSVAPFITCQSWQDEWPEQNRQLFNVIEIANPKCFIKTLPASNVNASKVVHAINVASVRENHNKITRFKIVT